ncbi:MAG: hypothetical protein J6T28_11150 [Paludibacteraceae bacterium]|nr:hypothetical protein [Paludibacteraceae bacterium]
MKKRQIITGFSALLLCAASFAEKPNNMQVWLKNGEREMFDISQVDSISFGESLTPEFKPLSNWTFIPTAESPTALMLSDEQKEFVRAGNTFAKKSFASICEADSSNPNTFYSPISLQIALGFCANAATDKGAKEIADAFGIQAKKPLEEMNDYFNKIILSLNSQVDSVILKVNNAAWPIWGAAVYDDFLKVAQEKYYATVRHLDYVSDPAAAKDTINKWAALMTNDCIKKLSILIDQSTVFVLNNACYFKGKWRIPIEKNMTRKETFWNTPTESQSVDMMQSVEYYSYAQTDDYQMVELVYGNPRSIPSNNGKGTYSMVIVLPSEGKNVDSTLNSIDWNDLSLNRNYVFLRFPKFGIRSKLNLNETVIKLGITDIFSGCPNAITAPATVTQIVQDSYVAVDEEGTEAAAVTSIGMAGAAPPEDMAEMLVNRPFGFAIREMTTGMLLFMGKVTMVEEVSKDK